MTSRTLLFALATLLASSVAQAAPANDVCAGAEVLNPTGPIPVLSTVVDITTATFASEMPFSCQASTKHSVWYTVTPAATGTYNFATCPASAPGNAISDTVIAIYTGGCGALTQVSGVCADDSCSLASSVTATLTGGVQYWVQAAAYGTSAYVSGPNNLQVSAAFYPPPSNDVCTTAEILNGNGPFPLASVASDLSQAAATADTAMTCKATIKNSIWYSFTPTVAGQYRFDTCSPYNTVTDTALAVFQGGCAALTEVPGACSDNVGSGTCGSRSSTVVTLAANDTYLIEVAAATAATLGQVTSAVQLTVAAVSSPPINDVCAGAIAIDNSAFPSLAPSVDVSWATKLGDPALTCSTNATALVWYTFVPPSTGVYRLSTCAAEAGSTLVDSVINLYTSNTDCTGTMTPVAATCIDNPGSTCANQAAVQVTLTANTTYYVLAGTPNATPVDPPGSKLGMAVFQIKPPANDTCSGSLPTLQVDTPTVLTTASTGSSVAIAINDSQVDAGCYSGLGNTATVKAIGRDVAAAFSAPATGSYSFKVSASSSTSVNTVAYVTDAAQCLAGTPASYDVPVCLAGANRVTTGSTALEEVACVPLSNGQAVNFWLDEAAVSTAGSSYTVEVVACFPEKEPNGLTTDALVNPPLSCPMTGSLSLADYDYYALANPASTGSRAFAMADTLAGNTADIVLRVTTDTDTLEFDDDDLGASFGANGSGLSPVIAGTPLPVGQSYLAVNGLSATTAYGVYHLWSVVQSGTPWAEVETNDSRATASAAASNYFSGDTSSPTDVDYFYFEAKPGEQLFVALDSYPARTPGVIATIASHTMDLLDASGAVLATSDDTATSVSTAIDGGALLGKNPAVPGDGLVYKVRTAGTYYVRVQRTGTTTGVVPYVLSISKNCGVGGGVGPASFSPPVPAQGTTVGGTQVTLTGSGFVPGRTTVTFGGAPAAIITATATTLVVTTPAGAPGAVDVTVTVPGNQATTITGAYTYAVPPSVGTLDVTSGPTAGGTACVLTGSDFQNGATIALGPNAATNVAFISATQLSFTTAATPKGTYPLTVTNPDGISGFANNAFTFIAPPALSSIAPTHGSTIGGEALTLAGQDFSATPEVKIDGVVAAASASGTATQLFVTAPANPVPGAKDVMVTNADGQAVTLTGAYTYYLPPTLTAVTPAIGATSGADPVTLTGTNFASGATVTFGTAPGVNVVFVSDTTLDVETPGVSPGVVDVTVTNPDGQSTTLTAAFTFVSAYARPLITSVTPASGTTHGGTTVTLVGTGLRPGVKVFLDGVLATGLSLSVATQTLTFTTPAHVYGAVAVTVTNNDNQSDTVAGAFTYVAPPPTLDGTPVSPVSGPAAGGTTLTLSGTEFLPGATVTVGGAACVTSAITATSITCTTPVTTAGAQDVVVTNTDGQSVTATGAFTSIDAPTFGSVTPATGTTAGGTAIAITGTNFLAPVTVDLGGVPATSVVLVSPTSLTAVAPAHAAGVVALKVTNGDGQSVTAPAAFTYYAAPTLTAVSPTSGPSAGNTTLTVTGTAFRAGAQVFLDSGAGPIAATSVVVVSATSITCKTPALAAGVASVTVTNDDGQTATLASAFTAYAPPVVTSIAPNSGLTLGGTVVTLTGSGFRTGVVVRFAGVSGTALVLGSGGTSLTVTTPARATGGAVDVVVTNTDAQAATVTGGFTYVYPAPTVTAVAPVSGYTAGGTAITVTGTGFLTGVLVKVGGADASSVVRVSATSLTAVTPAGAEGAADVVVTNPDTQSATLAGAFTFVPPPALTAIAPAHGSAQGGTTVTFTGAKLTPGATVKIGGVPVYAIAVAAGGASATGVTTAHSAGTFDAEWVNPDGQKTTLAQAFTYDAAPRLASLTPSTGSTAGGTTVTLTGTGFAAGATVLFDAAAATSVTLTSATELKAVSPAHAAGIVTVTVRNADGQSTALSNAFRFEAPPVLTSLTPITGPIAGGTAVQLKGSGFQAGATVTFGGAAATHVALIDATTLSAVTPAHAAGAVDVVVTNANGAAATLAGAFTFTRPAPSLASVAPASGPTAGGTVVVLRGTGFGPGATVTVGGQAATNVTVVDEGLVRATTAAHAAGATDVVVTNADGQSATATGAFTFVAPPVTDVGQVQDGGTGGLETPDAGPGNVSFGGGGGCGCTSVDGSALSLGGLALAVLLSRRRR